MIISKCRVVPEVPAAVTDNAGQTNKGNSSDDDSGDTNIAIIDSTTAMFYMSELIKYAPSHNNESMISNLHNPSHDLNTIKLSNAKQSEISDFFKKC